MDPTLTPGSARVVDPILTEVARGYMNAELVWPEIFPVVPVGMRGGNIISFGSESFADIDIRRAPGADVQVIDVGYAGDPYALVQRAIAGKLPEEIIQEAEMVPGIDLASLAIATAMKVASLQIEIAAAALVNPGNIGAGRTSALVGAAQWNHADSVPSRAVLQRREEIRRRVGMTPNRLLLSSDVFTALQTNADVVERIKYSQRAASVDITAELLAAYFNVERVIVGRSLKGQAGAFKDIWQNMALLTYSNVTPLAQMGSPSFGYTYRLRGYPMASPPWWDASKRSWIYPTTTEDTPVIAGAEAAYLWTNVLA